MTDKLLITGPAGCGTTSLILNRIKKRIDAGESESTLVVVPNYNHLQNLQMKLVKEHKVNGIPSGMFQTIDGLARLIAPDLMSKVVPLTYSKLLLKNILSRQHIGLSQEERKTGFRRRLGMLFHELRSVPNEKKEQLFKTLTNEFPDGPTGNGFVAKITKAFNENENELASRNFLSPESTRFVVASKIKPKDFSGFLYITGFDDLEEPQFAILNPLIKNAKEVIITLPGGHNWSFEQAVDLKNRFLQMGFKEEIIDETPRFSNVALANLETAIKKNERVNDLDGISLFLADGERDEAEYIARKTRAFIESGVNPEDILIVHPSPDNIALKLESEMIHVGVPFKNTIERTLKDISPIRDLLVILALLNGDFEHISSLAISRFAKPISELIKEISRKDIESLIANEKSECPDTKHKATWNLLRKFKKDSEKISNIHEFVNFINDVFKQTIYMPRQIDYDPSKFSSIAIDEFKSLLEEMKNFYSEFESESRFDGYLNDLINEAQSAAVKSKDRRASCVNLVGFDESRLKESRVTFLTGMNDKYFPPSVFTDPLLGDSTRKELVSRGYRFRTSDHYINRNRYLLYSALTRAKDELIITCPTIDEKGETLEVSPPLLECFNKSDWRRISHESLPIFTFDDLITESALSFEKDKSEKAKKNAIDEIRASYPLALIPLVTQDLLRGDIDPEYVKTTSYSSSRLEEYIACPFKYFAETILKIESAETGLEKILNPLIRGIAVHHYLALNLSPKPKKSSFPDSLKKTLEEHAFSIEDLDFHEESYIYDLEMVLTNFIESEIKRLEREGYSISSAELPFGMKESTPVKLKMSFGERSFSGRIDRIDKRDDSSLAIYDYKSSSRGISELYKEALQFQIPLYILALEKLGHALSRVGIITITRRGSNIKINNPDKDPAESIESISKSGEEMISQTISSIESGHFKPEPSDRKTCGWDKCGYYHVCRINH